MVKFIYLLLGKSYLMTIKCLRICNWECKTILWKQVDIKKLLYFDHVLHNTRSKWTKFKLTSKPTTKYSNHLKIYPCNIVSSWYIYIITYEIGQRISFDFAHIICFWPSTDSSSYSCPSFCALKQDTNTMRLLKQTDWWVRILLYALNK